MPKKLALLFLTFERIKFEKQNFFCTEERRPLTDRNTIELTIKLGSFNFNNRKNVFSATNKPILATTTTTTRLFFVRISLYGVKKDTVK